MNPLHSGLLLFLLELLLLLELFLAGVFGNTIWIFCPALSAQSLPFRLFRGLLCGNSSLYFIFRVINFPVPDCEDGSCTMPNRPWASQYRESAAG